MSGAGDGQVFAFAGFILDPRQRLLFGSDGHPVTLSARAFDTLLFLVEHPNQLIDKNALMKAVWPNAVVEDNNLNQNISTVRRALGETAGEHRFIVTVPGRGFRFVPVVTQRATDAMAAAPTAPAPTAPAPTAPAPTGPSAASAAAIPSITPSPSATPRPSALLPPSDLSAGPAPAALPAASPVVSGPPPHPGNLRVWSLGIAGVFAALLVLGASYMLVERLRAQDSPARPGAAGTGTAARTDIPSIAVLPFVNISSDKSQDYFSDGLTEELSTQLGQLRGVRVVGRASAFSFKGKNDDLRKIGAALGVDHLLEGSVRKSGDELRITAELIDVTNGSRLWSDVYNKRLDNIFAIQQEIGAAVAAALSSTLRGSANEALARTSNIAAYDAYLAGVARSKVGDSPQAIERLERAVALDPKFVAAWSSLAGVYESAPQTLVVSEAEYRKKAQSALARALELAPDSPQLMSQAASILTWENRDWLVMERQTRAALDRSDGSSYEANDFLGGILMEVGRPREAVEYLQRAQRAEPLEFGPANLLMEAFMDLGQYTQAEAVYEHARNLDGPEFLKAGSVQARAMALRDRAKVERTFADFPGALTDSLRAGLDHPEVALAAIRSAMYDPALQQSALVNGYLAQWAAYFGDDALALEALRKAFGPSGVSFLIWRPSLRNVRRLAGFKDLVRDLHLLDYWRASGHWSDFCRPLGSDDFECF